MPTATLTRRPVVTDDDRAAAGFDDAVAPRVARPPFIYRGAGDPHWRDQPCWVLSAELHPTGGEDREVVFACGCRSVVPAATLILIAD